MSYEEFVEEYNKCEISVMDIKRRVGYSAYSRYHKRAVENNDITLRPFNLRFGNTTRRYKYYHFDKGMGMYRVRRVINGVYNSYGFFETEEEAKRVVELCKKYNWDKTKISKVLK